MQVMKNIVGLMAGVALMAVMSGQVLADATPDDGPVYAGGSSEFDESAGGDVIDEGTVDPAVDVIPVDEVLVDPIETIGGGDGEPCIECSGTPVTVGDGDGSEGTPIMIDDGGVEVTGVRGGVTEDGGASPEVLRGDTGVKTPGQVQADSNASEDNAACIKRVGRSQAHRCMN